MQLILCPFCGHSSTDAEFCDACNREIAESQVQAAKLPATIDLGSGQLVECPFFELGWPDLNRSEAFPVSWDTSQRGRLHAISPQHWFSLRSVVEERANTLMPVLPPIKIIPFEDGAVIVAEEYACGQTASVLPAVTPGIDFVNAMLTMVDRCRLYGRLMAELHSRDMVWLNFDPDAVEVQGDAARITNLDTVLFRIGECPSRLRISPRYSPPEVCRFQAARIGPASDVFHLAMFAYYALANRLPHGFAGNGLESFAFQIPNLRIFQPLLPVGIWPVLAKGLQIDPSARQPGIAEFLEEFDAAVGRLAESGTLSRPKQSPAKSSFTDSSGTLLSEFPDGGVSREGAAQEVESPEPSVSAECDRIRRPEIGSLTITGRAKSALGGVNQDNIAVETIEANGQSIQVVIVADGVSVSKVGQGEVASQIACRVIMNSIRQEFAAASYAVDWQSVLQRACLRSTEAILEIAQCELDHRSGKGARSVLASDRPVADNDIMSTTAVVGVWERDVLHLANVGDSRAYLIARGIAEQLTVDGDVGTSLLAQGVPPNEVQELGVSAKALRHCLGACMFQSEAEGSVRLLAHPNRCRPTYSQWKLRPGNTFVFCTDGLVDEGVFLEPDELATIVSSGTNVPVQQLAEQLVFEADQKQRAPSTREPSGFGDNIACVVLRMPID
jgi:serine/threonine protein phosphatase PrpC